MCIYPESRLHRVRKKTSSVSNCNKFKQIFYYFGAHYLDDTFYEKHLRIVFEIYL